MLKKDKMREGFLLLVKGNELLVMGVLGVYMFVTEIGNGEEYF